MVNLGFHQEIEESVIVARVQAEQELAIAEKVKVGCVIEGIRRGVTVPHEYEYFGGSNIELSTTYVYHAEAIALTDCILHRYYPRRLFVSSQTKEEKTFLCGDCRQQLLEIHMNCEVIVLNPDGTRKNKTIITVGDLLPRHKNVRDKNKYYRALCGYSK